MANQQKEVKVTVECDGKFYLYKGEGCVIAVPDGSFVRGCMCGNVNWIDVLVAMREQLSDKAPFDTALELLANPEGWLRKAMAEMDLKGDMQQ